MAKNYYRSGDNNLTCDVCGKKMKASETRQRWDGFQVCRDDWEERQPQDFVRARNDKISVPVVRPQAPTPFVIPYGVFEQLKLLEKSVVTKILAPLFANDQLTVTDVFEVFRVIPITEQLKLQETIEYLVYTQRDFVDDLKLTEQALACFLDYVDPTYFAEIYVGTCVGA
jgi:hypothetical protein